MMFILICILFIVILLNIKETFITYKDPVPLLCYRKKNYTDNIYHFNNEMLIPDTYKPSKIGNKKNYKFNSHTIQNITMRNLINNIPKKIISNDYTEVFEPKNYSIYSNNYGTKFNIEDVLQFMLPSKNIILNSINIYLKKNYRKYHCNTLKMCTPKIIKRSLIKLEKNKHNSYRITFSCELYINNKSYSHILAVVTEIINNKHYINKISLIGNRFQDKINLLPGTDNITDYVNIYNSTLKNKYNTNKTYYRDSNENIKIIPNENTINNILKKKNENKLYSCVGKTAYNKTECESDINELGLKTIKGVWDKKCKYHIECPFYQANKNYPNRRGGCIDGKCEFPLGIKKISFRKYNSKSNPLCYNCKSSYNCCNQQKNKQIYPKIKTPDYIFKNDFKERNKFKNILFKNKLNIF
jgi:hypothetical protein